jgi:copper transport protein
VRRALLAVALVALALPAAASAHASLSSSVPGFRDRLEQSPTRVVLRFSQVIQPIPNGIVVQNENGRVVSLPAALGTDRRSLIALLHPLARGAYAVRWQTMSVSDGHIVSGLFTFGVRVNAPPPTEAVGASGPSTTEKLVRWIAYLGLAVVAGGLAVRLLVLPRTLPERLDQAFFALVGAATVVTTNAGIAALLLRAGAALQLPFDRFLYADLSPFAGGTRFGIAWVWMTLACAVVGTLLTLAWLRRSRAPLWPALALVLALAAGFSSSGHSASEPNATPLTVAADWVHIAAASIWVGGLVALALIGWRLDRPQRHAAFLGFSRIATAMVGVVLLAGIYLGITRLPAFSDLWSTTYGHVLLVKIALVALALAWGAAHHFLLRPRLERGDEPPGGRVGRSLVGESLVGVAVLLVAAMLVNTAPPEEQPSTPEAASGVAAAPR